MKRRAHADPFADAVLCIALVGALWFVLTGAPIERVATFEPEHIDVACGETLRENHWEAVTQ